MRKLILLMTFLIGIAFSTSTFAAECKIQTGPSQKLSQYFNDVKSILSEVQKNISDSKCEGVVSGTGFFSNTKENASDGYNKIIGDTNGLLNIDRFTSSWDMDIYPIFNGGLPDAFYRDHDYIVKQSGLINNMTVTASNKCATEKIIDSELIKKKFDTYGIRQQSKIGDILSELRKFNIKLSSYFRCSIAGSMSECSLDGADELALDIKTDYRGNLNSCNQNETGFKKIMDKISAVFDSTYGFAGIAEGIKEWKQSISLLTGGDYYGKEYSAVEKSLLTKELSRQGLNTSQASGALANLACMNNADTTVIACIGENIKSFWSPFSELIEEIQKGDIFNAKNTNEAPKNVDNTRLYSDVMKDVRSNYENLKTIIETQNKTSDKAITSLINLHSNLIDTNVNLESKITIARGLCNRQATGVGNCNGK